MVVDWQQHPYYHMLEPRAFAALRRRMAIHQLQRGAILSQEGEPCTAVYWVAEGRLRVITLALNGRDHTLTEAAKGQVLNLVPALDGGPAPATIVAATRAAVFALPCTALEELVQQYPQLASLLLHDLAARLRQQTAQAADLALRSVAERLARLLVGAAASADGLHTTQREMASRLGTVREVVARELARFEERGWVKLGRGSIEITDLQALKDLVELGEA
ncbi:MAG: Crp/Fnr family transcriptional regulator [Anaerolineae bacterium]